MAKKNNSSRPLLRLLVAMVLLLLVVGGVKLFSLYKRVYWPNVAVEAQKNGYLYIPTGANLETVAGLLEQKEYILNRHTFEWVAERKNYRGNLIVPGKYKLHDGMSNQQLIDHLRAGNGRLEVKLTFNNLRTLEELAGRMGSQLEPDSTHFLAVLSSTDVMAHYGFNRHTFPAMFIPNTYHLDWASSTESVIERMAEEFKKFWTAERVQKARALGLSQSEVVTLASIVQAEQRLRPDEHKRIAGLYLNRLRKGMKLQSDPTVIFAVGDFSINRVLYKHLEYDHPYNTYRNVGLPPGPILFPDVGAVDAVLNAEQHNFIFMCAREDFSGYHYFSTNLREHNRYAEKYRRALNERKIYK